MGTDGLGAGASPLVLGLRRSRMVRRPVEGAREVATQPPPPSPNTTVSQPTNRQKNHGSATLWAPSTYSDSSSGHGKGEIERNKEQLGPPPLYVRLGSAKTSLPPPLVSNSHPWGRELRPPGEGGSAQPRIDRGESLTRRAMFTIKSNKMGRRLGRRGGPPEGPQNASRPMVFWCGGLGGFNAVWVLGWETNGLQQFVLRGPVGDQEACKPKQKKRPCRNPCTAAGILLDLQKGNVAWRSAS